MGRAIVVKEVSGTTEERQTKSWYCDGKRRMIVRSDLSGRAGSGQLVTVTDYDQAGRERLRRSYEGDAPGMPSGSPTTSHCRAYDSETAGIKVETHYRYVKTGSKPGLYTTTSNPYRGTAKAGWTRTRADQLGRGVEVAHFSGAAKPSTSSRSHPGARPRPPTTGNTPPSPTRPARRGVAASGRAGPPGAGG